MQVKQLAPGGKPDYRMLRDMVAYLSEYPDEFHHPLEDLVFRRLEKLDHEMVRHVEELLREHQDMAQETRYLLTTLNAICEGNQKPLRKSLYDYFRDYIEMYRAHINIEEGTVFPAARKHLSKEDWDYVEANAKEAEDPLFNDFVSKEYETLAAYLKNQREGARAEFALIEIFSIYAVIESTQAVFEGVAQAQEVCVKHGKKALNQQMDCIRKSSEEGGSAWLSLPGKLTSNCLKQTKASAEALGEVAKVTWNGSTAPYTSRFASLLRLWT
jgi:hemerythrin-like domain-containing protein